MHNGIAAGKMTIETLITDSIVQAGQSVRVRFKITDVETKEKKRGLSDLRSLVFLAPGISSSEDVPSSPSPGAMPPAGPGAPFSQGETPAAQRRRLAVRC